MSSTNVPAVDVDRSLGDLVTERPDVARVFERFGLDYCCNGHRTLAEASEAAGLDPLVIAAEFPTDRDQQEVAAALGPVELVHHIVDVHHAYLHEELPLLDALATKVRDVHRARHPELEDVAALVVDIRRDLEPHLAKEEQVLFPAIEELADGEAALPLGDIASPIRTIMAEHDQVGDLLRRLRTASGSYVVPVDGCASYRMLYERLEGLEADTFRHVHLENNILFPAVLG